MAKYTLELRQIENSRNMRVFDFDYDFYNNDLKPVFERKFVDHYFFHEIGFETVQRFKHRLKTKLNEIMPYYSQLYQTELASKDINFLLNKDLTETTIRELNKTDNTNNSTNSNETNNNSTSGTDNTNFSESSLDDGVARLDYDSVTTINKNLNDYRNTSNGSNTSSSNSSSSNEGNERESLTLKSQGNIGITSSAELLEKWRSVIINIDQQIINECKGLFMEVY